jgi:hypothetical protein
MGRIIFAVALAGWAAIMAVAWRLADARIPVCKEADTYTAEANCIIHATATRDNILTLGLSGALAIIVLALFIYGSARRGSAPAKSGWHPANPARRVLPR